MAVIHRSRSSRWNSSRINVATVHEQPQRSLTVVSGDHVCQAVTESETRRRWPCDGDDVARGGHDACPMFDIELTNRCNAELQLLPSRSHAAPRAHVRRRVLRGPLADSRVPAEVVARLGATSQRVTFCGSGDVLMHPRAVQGVAAVRAAGIRCELNTNVGLLNDAKARALAPAAGPPADQSERRCHRRRLRGDSMACRSSGTFEMWFGSGNSLPGRCHIVVVLVGDREESDRLNDVENLLAAIWVRAFPSACLRVPWCALACVRVSVRRTRVLRRRHEPLRQPDADRRGVGCRSYPCSSGTTAITTCAPTIGRRSPTWARVRTADRRCDPKPSPPCGVSGAPCRTCNFDPVNRVAAALVEAGARSRPASGRQCPEALGDRPKLRRAQRRAPGRSRDSGARRPSRDHPRRTITRHCAGHLPEPRPERHVIRAAGLTADSWRDPLTA